MKLGTASVIRGDARNPPLADNTVDLVVTSPPYFALRSYQDGGEHYAGQIGAEPTPAEFVAALLEVTAECVRVLKPSGSLFVNLGDKYASSGGHGATKSLMGIPWRYALACIDDLGLILRAEVIWSKPNGLPESVTDRVRRSHEQWFHFTLQPRYFSAVDEIREPHKSEPGREGRGALGGQKSLRPVGPNSGAYNTLGALPGSVWTIPTEPLRIPDHLGIDHFAAFPTEWPKRIIQGWSPPGVCVECREGRRPVADRERFPLQAIHNGHMTATPAAPDGRNSVPHGSTTTITGYACACAPWDCHGELPPTTPGVVLDPFGGTGTTALVAKALGRHGISVDMSADYCRLAEWRTNDRDQLAKVLGLGKLAAPTQEETLFDMDGGAA